MSPEAMKKFKAKIEADNALAVYGPPVVTAGQRAYQDYFQQRGGVNSQGGRLPGWSELPADMRGWWESAGVNPPGAPPLWKNKVFWFNALVLVLAYAEANAGMLKDYLPGSIYAYVAFGLPVANKVIKLIQLFRARP
jgi:hypothetical protein